MITMNRPMIAIVLTAFALGIGAAATAQDIPVRAVDTWVTVTGAAAGSDLTAQEEAIANALRKALEQACGTFLTAEAQSKNYALVYEKIFANAVGYVIEHKDPQIYVEGGTTYAKVNARVSTEKFEKDWATIAHTVAREGNPRVMIAIADATWTTTRPAEESITAGVVQGKLEDFFLSRGLQLVDWRTAADVKNRDIALAALKGDAQELAAFGARFKADVVIYGQSSHRYSGTVQLAGQELHKFVATLNVRAIRTDSAQLMVSKTYGPLTKTSLQWGAGGAGALAALAEESAPKLLAEVVEAWRKQIHAARDIQLNILGMDYEGWSAFRGQAERIRGLRSLGLKEITEGVAHISVKYEYDAQTLADRLTQLQGTNLTVVEFNPNRLKMKMTRPQETPETQPRGQ